MLNYTLDIALGLQLNPYIIQNISASGIGTISSASLYLTENAVSNPIVN